MPTSPSTAIQAVRYYISHLDLPYEIHYGKPTRRTRKSRSLYIEFYRVPITFRDVDGTILGVNLFVD